MTSMTPGCQIIQLELYSLNTMKINCLHYIDCRTQWWSLKMESITEDIPNGVNPAVKILGLKDFY